jgi:hypothetical protein
MRRQTLVSLTTKSQAFCKDDMPKSETTRDAESALLEIKIVSKFFKSKDKDKEERQKEKDCQTRLS